MSVSGPSPMPMLRVIDPRRAARNRWLRVGFWIATVVAAYLIGRYVMIPDADGLLAQLEASKAAESEMRQRLSETEQRLAIVERAEQIARLANENVQGALAEKDSEIAQLKRDQTLYDRLIGSGAGRQALSIYDIGVRQEEGGNASFRAIVVQTRDVRKQNEGTLTLQVDGQRDGKQERLDWEDVAPEAVRDKGIPYDFRYFQRIEGQFRLPDGFAPASVRVVLKGQDGKTVDREFPWRQIIKTEGE